VHLVAQCVEHTRQFPFTPKCLSSAVLLHFNFSRHLTSLSRLRLGLPVASTVDLGSCPSRSPSLINSCWLAAGMARTSRNYRKPNVSTVPPSSHAERQTMAIYDGSGYVTPTTERSPAGLDVSRLSEDLEPLGITSDDSRRMYISQYFVIC
jgi:hypothetical protein